MPRPLWPRLCMETGRAARQGGLDGQWLFRRNTLESHTIPLASCFPQWIARLFDAEALHASLEQLTSQEGVVQWVNREAQTLRPQQLLGLLKGTP